MVGYVGDPVNGADAYAAGQSYLYTELVDKANAASTDDHLLNDKELEKFLESLVGGDITPEQARMLIKIYGNGTVVDDRTIIEAMTTDGFLTVVPGDAGSLKWSINWDNIDGALIANALYREVGLDPFLDTMTPEQFDDATDKLFGDRKGVKREDAIFLSHNYGVNGTLNHQAITGLFERGDIHIHGVSGEGYTRIYVNPSDTRAHFATNEEAADYLMSFDDGDGFLTREELQKAIESRLADGAGVDDDIMMQYMNYYGEKHPLGEMIVTRDGVMAMLNDTSLNLSARGSEGGNGFGINLHITPVDRVIHGYSYWDAESLNDGVISEDELIAMFKRLGIDLTKEQAAFLIDVYGDGAYMTVTDVQRMRDDGFMVTGNIMIDPVTLDWNAIDGVLLARAVFWAAGVDPNVEGATLTPEQFNAGVDKLFGNTKGQSLDDAKFQTKIFGAGNVLTVDQMAAVFNSPTMDINGEQGKGHITIHAYTDRAEMTTVEQQINYLMSFDEDNYGVLSEAELLKAIKADNNDHNNSLNKDLIHRLALIYGIKQDDGSYVFDPAALHHMHDDGVLVEMPNKPGNHNEFGLKVTLDLVTNERLIDAMFRYLGKDPATDTLTAEEFETAIDNVTGDKNPVGKHNRDQIVSTYGSVGPDGVPSISRQDMINMFNSAGIRRGGVDSRTFLPIIVSKEWGPPPYTYEAWWNTIVKWMGAAGKSFIEALAAATGHTPEEIAKALNETGGNLAHNLDIVKNIIMAVINGVKAGAEWAMGVIDMVIGALLNDPNITDEGKAMLEQAYEDARSGIDSGAVAFLMQILGMTPEEAINFIKEGGKYTDVGKLDYETFDRYFNLNALWASGEQQYTTDPSMPGGGEPELELTGRHLEAFLSSPEGAQFRFDYAVEWNFGTVGNNSVMGLHTFDGRQVRIFVTHPRENANGERTFDVRIRFMDEAGATGSPSNFFSVDGGLFTSHDIVLRFTDKDPGEGTDWQRETFYKSSAEIIVEGDLNATQLLQMIYFLGSEAFAWAREKWQEYFGTPMPEVVDPNGAPPEPGETRIYLRADGTSSTTMPPPEEAFMAIDVTLPPGQTVLEGAPLDPLILGVTQEEWTAFTQFLKANVGNKLDGELGFGLGFTTTIDVTGREWALAGLIASDAFAYGIGFTYLGGTHAGSDAGMIAWDIVLEQIINRNGGPADISLEGFYWHDLRISGPQYEIPGDDSPTSHKPRIRFQWNWAWGLGSDLKESGATPPPPPAAA